MGLLTESGWAQFGNFQPDPDTVERVSPVVPVPGELRSVLNDAQQQLEEGEVASALAFLQFVLEAPEDFFADETLRKSLKQSAAELLASLPAHQRESYEAQFQAAAQFLQQRVVESGRIADRQLLLSRYGNTSAGQMGLQREALRAYDEERYLDAARLWEAVPGAAVRPAQRLQHALAWWQAGQFAKATAVLSAQAAGQATRIVLGDQAWEIPADPAAQRDWLTQQLQGSTAGPVPRQDWLTFRGYATHNAIAVPAGPVGARVWSQALDGGFVPWYETEFGKPANLADWQAQLQELVEEYQVEDQLLLPGSHPLVVHDQVIVRTPFHIEAYHLKSGELQWRSILTERALSAALKPLTVNQVDEELVLQRRGAAREYLEELLFRDQISGTMSSDGERIYAVQQPPYLSQEAQVSVMFGGVEAVVSMTNHLTAYAVDGGRLEWEIGGARRETPQLLAGVYFLGPPLCLDGQLFVLGEMGGELRLFQLSPGPEPTLVWSQVIAAPNFPLQFTDLRRLAGLTPAASEHLLICPTSSGLVVAVDPLQRRLVWGYEYQSLEAQLATNVRQIAILRMQNQMLPGDVDERQSRWLDSAPTIANGHVLLTPRDSVDLHCVDLLTGELKWKQPRGRRLYVAGVYAGRVLIVGREQVEALDITSGQPVWQQPLPIIEPSGRGLALAGQYLLPLSSGEIIGIDYETGKLRFKSRLGQGHRPGNLAAGSGALVSQNLTSLTAYRSLSEIQQQIATVLPQSPDDPEALALRGELALFAGDQAAALADLRTAIDLHPNPHAGSVYADLLIAGMQHDFPRYREEIERIDRLITDPEQRSEFITRVAAGFEQSGEHRKAFEQFLRLTLDTKPTFRLERQSDHLMVRRDRLIRGHVQGLLASASSADRDIMEGMLAERARAIIDPQEPASHQRFLDYFDGTRLADQIRLRELNLSTELSVTERMAEWSRLADSREPAIAAFAVAKLARTGLDRRRLDEAQAWINRLQRDYRTQEITPGQTAEALVQSWQREIDALKIGSELTWPSQSFTAVREPRHPEFRRSSIVEQVGPRHPVFGDWTFEVTEDAPAILIARDAASRRRWSVALPFELIQNQPFFGPRNSAPQLHISGPYFALSFGTAFLVFDVATPNAVPRYLWHRSLLQTTPNPALPTISSTLRASGVTVRVEYMPSGRRRVRAVEGDSFLTVGQFIGASTEQVCYQIGSRLMAADTDTGELLWVRRDVPSQAEAIADDQHVLLLDPQTSEALLFRATDGELLTQRPVPLVDAWLWFGGTQLISFVGPPETRTLECLDVLTGQKRWTESLSPTTRCAMLEDGGVACLDQNGQWRVLDRVTGQERSSGTTPKFSRLDFLWVQPENDGYLVVAGATTPVAKDLVVGTYEGNQVPIAGRVLKIPLGGKQPVWQVPLPPTAFQVIQPSNIPILAFAGRVLSHPTAEEPNPRARFSALFLDRRTGEVVFKADDPAAPGMYQFEFDGDRRRIKANFLTFVVEMQPQPAEGTEPAGQ